MVAKVIEQRFNDTINEIRHFSHYVTSYVTEQQKKHTSSSIGTSSASSGSVISTDRIWPYVSIPAFDTFSSNLLRLTRSDHISLIPLVHIDELWAWSSYATINQEWAKSTKSSSTNANDDDDDYDRYSIAYISNDIYEFVNGTDEIIVITTDVVANTTRYPLAPLWQTNTLPSLDDVNYNTLSLPYMQQLFDMMQQTPDTVTVSFGPIISNDTLNKHWIPSLQNHHTKDGKGDGTVKMNKKTGTTSSSIIISPILYEGKQTIRPTTSTGGETTVYTTQIVAMIAVDFQWIQFLSNLLEIQYLKTGMLFDITSNCSNGQQQEALLFRTVDGYNVEHLNRDDYSGQFLNGIGSRIELDPILESLSGSPKHTMCSYSIMVYPTRAVIEIESSSTIEDDDTSRNDMSIKTNLHVLLPTVISAAFIIVLITFLIFDMYVRTKIRMIIQTAAESNRIISSLFPSTVRHRLFGGGDDDDNNNNNGGFSLNNNEMMTPVSQQLASKHLGGDRRQNHFSSDQSVDSCDKSMDENFFDDDDDDDAVVFKTKPIADLFPEVTIMVRLFIIFCFLFCFVLFFCQYCL
jgi:hypothetical protein